VREKEIDMKLTYWVAKCENDSDAYSIRERTKKAAVAKRVEMVEQTYGRESDYGPVKKVEVEYRDAFDLMELCSDESHHHWEEGD
jgi:hypothetical protein